MADSPHAAKAAVHAALGAFLDEGEIAVGWVLVMEVAGPNGGRYLAHRAGGGVDGSDAPTPWTALGMLRTSTQDAEDQLRDIRSDADEDPRG